MKAIIRLTNDGWKLEYNKGLYENFSLVYGLKISPKDLDQVSLNRDSYELPDGTKIYLEIDGEQVGEIVNQEVREKLIILELKNEIFKL